MSNGNFAIISQFHCLLWFYTLNWSLKGLKAWVGMTGVGGEAITLLFAGLSPLSYLLSLSVCSGCIIKFCFFLLFAPETYQFGLLQELKTGYKDETDFTTGLELHIRKTNKQEGLEDPHQKNRCTVTGRDIKEVRGKFLMKHVFCGQVNRK